MVSAEISKSFMILVSATSGLCEADASMAMEVVRIASEDDEEGLCKIKQNEKKKKKEGRKEGRKKRKEEGKEV